VHWREFQLSYWSGMEYSHHEEYSLGNKLKIGRRFVYKEAKVNQLHVSPCKSFENAVAAVNCRRRRRRRHHSRLVCF